MNDDTEKQGGQFHTGLRWRIALAGTIIFLLPFGLFLAVVNSASERLVREDIYSRLQAGVAANAQLFDDVFDVRVTETNSLGRALAQASSPLKQWPGILRGVIESSPWYQSVLIADPSGHILAGSAEVGGSVQDWVAFRRALAGDTGISDIFLSSVAHKPEMVLAVPLRGKDGEVIYVLLAALRLEKLNSRLINLAVGRTEDSFLADAAGRLVSASRTGTLALGSRIFKRSETNLLRDEEGTAEFRDSRGQQVLCAYRKLRSKDYFLVAEINRVEFLDLAHQLRRMILLYVAPFLGLGVILAIIVWHFGMNHIERLTSQLWRALLVAQQRERERDLVVQQLARRFDEERELAKQKERFQAQLAEYEKYAALAQLALGAAHEINNPLLGVLSHLELELRQETGAEQREEIQQCIEGTKRISSTVRGLLNYARPGPLQLSHIHLNQLLNDMFAFLSHQPLFRGIQLETKIRADLPAITADVNQLSQVLMNLLLNAAEAMPEGGRITVAAEKVKFSEQVEVCVTDTGCGIAADVLPRIFEPFFTTKRGKGTGLGLSISRGYVHSHGGEIQVESIPQRGTTVRIRLPIHQEGRHVLEVEEIIT